MTLGILNTKQAQAKGMFSQPVEKLLIDNVISKNVIKN